MTTVRQILRWGVAAGLICACVAMPIRHVQAEFAGSSPLSMVRSLQFVQDAIVRGDHSAIDMQHHLLRLIDERLRAAGPDTLGSADTADAVLIYAMSGGNPATLSFMAEHLDGPIPEIEHTPSGDEDEPAHDEDHAGEEGEEPPVAESQATMADVGQLVQTYLAGRGEAVADELVALLPHFRQHRIEPYLVLITANALADQDPEDALPLFDRARLLAPGTNIEEAALRRTIELAEREGQIDLGINQSERYARRFLHSPYANQFADLLVELVIAHPEAIRAQKVRHILDFMDPDRRRSVYLRIARKSAISGGKALAMEAAEAAEALSADNDKVHALADLYAGAAGVPSDDIVKAAQDIDQIDPAVLSPRDIALRAAARSVADAVIRAPSPTDEGLQRLGDDDAKGVDAEPLQGQEADAGQTIETYLSDRRTILSAVDRLLEENE